MNLLAQSPDGPREGVPVRFGWQAREVAPPFTLVLLDAGYRNLACVAGIAGTCWVPDARVASCLAVGGTFHWFVSCKQCGVPCRSPLVSFEIR